MHIERIYIQDNFVPDLVTDQFRRKVIGVSVCLKEGEGTIEAEAFAEQYIKDYIQKNTVGPNVTGVSSVADNIPVPIVQVEPKTKEEKQKELISSCTVLEKPDGLLSFEKLVKNNPHLQQVYDETFQKLTNPSINV